MICPVDDLDLDLSDNELDRDLADDGLDGDHQSDDNLDRDHQSDDDLDRDDPSNVRVNNVFLLLFISSAIFSSGNGSDDVNVNGVGRGYVAPRGRSRYRQAAKAVATAVATGGVGAAGSSVWGAGRRANAIGGRNGPQQYELEACTFSPVVIGARKGMSQAQQYLQVSAFLSFLFLSFFFAITKLLCIKT